MKGIKKFFLGSKKTAKPVTNNDCKIDKKTSRSVDSYSTADSGSDSDNFEVEKVYEAEEVLSPSPTVTVSSSSSSVPPLDLPSADGSSTSCSSARVLKHECAASANARRTLADALSNGLVVTRHYLNGKPERKKLICNPTVSTLMCQPLESDQDELRMTDILELRLGSEIEQLYNSHSPKTMIGFVNTFFLNEKTESSKSADVLQKSCRPEKLRLCFSLVCADRTVDIQCFSNKDYTLLVTNLAELIGITPPLSPRMDSASRHNSHGSIRSIMSKSSMSLTSRKSVKFADDHASISRTNSVTSFDDEDNSILHNADNIVYLIGEDYDDLLPNSNSSSRPSSMKRPSSNSSNSNHIPASNNKNTTPYNSPEKAKRSMFSVTPPASPDKRVGQLLTHQQNCFGTNMYSSLKPEDEVVLHMLMRQGMDEEEAVQHLFERRFLVNKTLEPEAPVSKATVSTIKKSHTYRMSEEDLSELIIRQERNFGVNMFDSITDADEMKIQRMLTLGYAYDEAALAIFKEKVTNKVNSSFHVNTQQPMYSMYGNTNHY